MPRPRITVVNADCIKWMQKKSTTPFKMVFADPPFNIGMVYDKYHDRQKTTDYLDWLREWVTLAKRHTDTHGVLCIHGDRWVSDCTRISCKLGYKMSETARIVWHYRFGQHSHTNWISSYAICSVYSWGNHTFNADSVLVESDRSSTYNDSRTQTKTTGTPGLRVPFDVWGIPSDGPYWGRVQGNNKERVCKKTGYKADHPNQLPEVYLARLIKAYTNPGDTILDIFGGTGTTAVVAKALGRNCTIIEKSKAYCEDIRKRLRRGALRDFT